MTKDKPIEEGKTRKGGVNQGPRGTRPKNPHQSPMTFAHNHIIDDKVPTQKDLSLDQRIAVLVGLDYDKILFGHVSAIYSNKYYRTICSVGIYIEDWGRLEFFPFDRIRTIKPIATQKQLWTIIQNDAIDSKSKVELLKSLRDCGLIDIKLPSNERELPKCRDEKENSNS